MSKASQSNMRSCIGKTNKQTNKEIIRILSTDPDFNKVKKNGKEIINIKTFEIVPPCATLAVLELVLVDQSSGWESMAR